MHAIAATMTGDQDNPLDAKAVARIYYDHIFRFYGLSSSLVSVPFGRNFISCVVHPCLCPPRSARRRMGLRSNTGSVTVWASQYVAIAVHVRIAKWGLVVSVRSSFFQLSYRALLVSSSLRAINLIIEAMLFFKDR